MTIYPAGTKVVDIRHFDRSTKVSFQCSAHGGPVWFSKQPSCSNWFSREAEEVHACPCNLLMYVTTEPYDDGVVEEVIEVYPTGVFLVNGSFSDTPAGYQYSGSSYCPEDLIERLIHHHEVPTYARDINPEVVLNELALKAKVNRRDEYTFDSDEFPKVIVQDDTTDCEVCGKRL